MKLLHTADWHLGVKTMGKDRLSGQKETIKEICDIADINNVDVVVIAGDIYNTSVPTAEAEELFYEAIEKLSNNGNRFVLVVSGNHDDPERLCAGDPLAYSHNILVAGDLESKKVNRFVKGKQIAVVGTDYGFVKIKKGDEIMNIAYLPFDCTITETINFEDKNYSNIVKELSSKTAKNFKDNEYNVFVSHLFAVGSRLFGDRSVSVGDVFAVSTSDLPKSDYIALGHIHGAQKLNNNAYYSGAISRLRAGEYEVSVNLVEFNNKQNINVETIKLNSSEKYLDVVAHSIEEARYELSKLENKDLAQLNLILSETLKSSELKQLKKDFPCITSISLEIKAGDNFVETTPLSRRNLSDKELFVEFYKKKKGVEPKESLIEMFLKCKGGSNETN